MCMDSIVKIQPAAYKPDVLELVAHILSEIYIFSGSDVLLTPLGNKLKT